MSKRTNKLSVPVIGVAKNDQALATGTLTSATSDLNINDGQLGVLSWDFKGTKPLGTFIASSDDANDVNAIKILVGTPASSASHLADVWEVGDKAYVESGVIRAGQIRSVSVLKARFPKWGGAVATSFPTPVDDVEYKAYVRLLSVRHDRDYGKNNDVLSVVVPATDFTGLSITSPKDYVIKTMVDKINRYSKLVNQNGNQAKGNQDVVALAVRTTGFTAGAGTAVLTSQVLTSITVATAGTGYETAPTVTITGGGGSGATATATINAAGAITGFTVVTGGSGYTSVPTVVLSGGGITTIGTIVPGTVVPFQTINGVTSSITADEAFVRALAELVNSNADLTGTSVIAVTNAATAGVGAKSDGMIVLGLPATTAAYFDNIQHTQTTAEVSFGGGFQTAAVKPTVTKMWADEGTGQGSKWIINSADRYLLTVHTMQNHPHGEFFKAGKDYIEETKLYTSYSIDFYDTEEALNTTITSPKNVTILFPCEKDSSFTPSVNNIVTRLAAGNTPITMVTSDGAGTGTASANTVSSVNNILDAWLESARGIKSFDLYGEAVVGGPYLS